jgi:transglutaminase-like putative cysteine protease
VRLRIAHSSVYRYDPPAAGVIQVLRLTPRNHEGQYVERWRIDVVPDARLAAHEDAFGNITHVLTADGPLNELRVEVDGDVEMQNTHGVVRGTVERFPPSLFLRDTALTQADTAIRAFAAKISDSSDGEVLAELHGLLDRLFEDLAGDSAAGDAGSSPAPVNAAEAFARKRGAAKDLAHIFIGAAHTLGIPARYVGGYYRHADNGADADTSGHQPRLGRSLCARSRLGRLRSVQRLLPDRRPCPRRHRARFARRRTDARHPLGRRRRDFGRCHQGRSVMVPATR